MFKSVAWDMVQKKILTPLLGANLGQPVRFRRPSPCYTSFRPRDRKPCFDIRNVTIEFGNRCHAQIIRSFLYNHHWPREPSVVGLWMPLQSQYLRVITDKYAKSGDRLLAYEYIPRTGERKMVGVTVGNKVYPWAAEELEAWAHNTPSKAERHRMYFIAHCYKSPNLFTKYNVDYIYDVEILATASEVTAQGVGTKLLQTILDHCRELRHPLVQVIAFSQYTARICEKCDMKREWSVNYRDFVDDAGQRVFFPRRPHHTVAIYVKYNDPKLGGVLPVQPISD